VPADSYRLWPPSDVKINNDGLMPRSPLERLKIDDWDRSRLALRPYSCRDLHGLCASTSKNMKNSLRCQVSFLRSQTGIH